MTRRGNSCGALSASTTAIASSIRWRITVGRFTTISASSCWASRRGLRAAGGSIDVAGLHDRQLPGLAVWAVIGLFPMLGAGLGRWSLRRRGRCSFVGAVTAVAAVFIGTLAAFGGVALDQHKAPRLLVRWSGARQTDREVRVACYQYFQPSLVFYCGREVQILPSEREALEFLRCPLPVFLFLPETV